MAPFLGIPVQHRMMTPMPMGWTAEHFKSEQPTQTYEGYNRTTIMEQGRPITQPVNLSMCDSSSYSFASGKLDTLGYRSELDGERARCDFQVLNQVFREFFLELTLVRRRRFQPLYGWDWPAHPVIDVEAEARAVDTDLKNGMTTFRDAYSAKGQDYDDALEVMARDWFGKSSPENIDKARQINLLRNLSKDALPYVAQLLGVTPPQPQGTAA